MNMTHRQVLNILLARYLDPIVQDLGIGRLVAGLDVRNLVQFIK